MVLVGNVFLRVARGMLACTALPSSAPLASFLGTVGWRGVPCLHQREYHFISKGRFLRNLGGLKKPAQTSSLCWPHYICVSGLRIIFLAFLLYHSQQTPCDFIFTTLSPCPNQAIFRRWTKMSSNTIKHFLAVIRTGKPTSMGI